MITPVVIGLGRFTVTMLDGTGANSIIRTININSLDDAQEVASVPVFTSFNTSEQTPFINFSPTSSTFESGLYPSNLPDSGSVAGTRRDFEDVVVIVNPANAEAAKVQLYGRVDRQVSGGRNFITTTVTFRNYVAIVNTTVPLFNNEVINGEYQFLAIKLTTLKNSN